MVTSEERDPGVERAIEQGRVKAHRLGGFSLKDRELMYASISVVLGCEDCIKLHVVGAAREGATRDEILEATGAGRPEEGISERISAIVFEALDELGM
jgi:AhpD family alkylhydroperoxidase